MAGERILAIDDEAFFRTLYEDLLTPDGYRVETAANGAEALERLAHAAPDLVLLDLIMPGMDGLETLRRLRGTQPDLPVVIVTGERDIRAAIETLKAGATDYLTKPVEPDEFRVTIRRLLETVQTKREHAALLQENLVQLQTLAVLGRAQEALGQARSGRRLEALLAVAAAEVAASRAVLLYTAGTSGRLVPVAAQGYLPEAVPVSGVPLGEGLLGALVARGVPAVIRGETVRERGSPVERGLVGDGALLIPVAAGGEPRAALLLAGVKKGDSFGVTEAERLLPLALPLALALQLRETELGGAAAERVAVTGSSPLEERLDEEISNARRKGRACALLVVGLETLRRVLGQEEGRQTVAEIETTIRATAPPPSTVLVLPEGDFGIVLAETDYQGAITAANRIERALHAAPFGEGLFLTIPTAVSYGIAAFPVHGEGAATLIARARKGLGQGGKGPARTESVWKLLNRLLAEAEQRGEPVPSQGMLKPGSRDLRWVADPQEYENLEAQLAEELLQSATAEGILFVGVGKAAEGPTHLPRLRALQERGLQVLLLAGEDGTAIPGEGLTLVLAPDPDLERTRFVLYYGIRASYGLVGRQNGRFRGLLTGSPLIVNELMRKLEEQYLGQQGVGGDREPWA